MEIRKLQTKERVLGPWSTKTLYRLFSLNMLTTIKISKCLGHSGGGLQI